MGRESVLSRQHLHQPGKSAVISHYDGTRKELLILCGCTLPERAEFNQFLADARKAGEVNRVTLFVCQELYRESWDFFRHHGFERHMSRENKHPWFVLVKSPAEPWSI